MAEEVGGVGWRRESKEEDSEEDGQQEVEKVWEGREGAGAGGEVGWGKLSHNRSRWKLHSSEFVQAKS